MDQAFTKVDENKKPKGVRRTKKEIDDEQTIENIQWLEENGFAMNIDVQKGQDYMGFTMYFLKSPINYKLAFTVGLIKTKFGYAIEKIHNSDLREMKILSTRINPDMLKINDSTYINGKSTNFMNDAFPGEPIQFLIGKRWKVLIQFQGYKIGDSGKPTRIWKLLEARLCSF